LNRSIAIWSSPKFPAYNSNHARLRTFGKWPLGMNPSLDSLSAAGFYLMGRTILATFLDLSLNSNHLSLKSVTGTYRCVWSEGLFPLLGRIGALGNHRRYFRGTCFLFPILCLSDI
jgi:hypothetical protein